MGRLVFALTLGIYLWTAAPSAGWLDSSELVAASASLGVAHPPGEPIPTLLGRAAMLIPIGDAYFRINAASALAAALAAWLMYVCALALSRRIRRPEPDSIAEAIAAALVAIGFALCGASWIQAVRAEVYAVEAALCLGTLAAALRYDELRELRWLAVAALAAGLALATHHYVTLLVIVPVLAAIVARRAAAGWRGGARKAGLVIACGALGLTTFLYIPARAARDPLVDWGDATTAGRLVWTVSARAFQKSLGPARHPPLGEELADVSSAVAEQAGAIALLLALVGLYLLLRWRETRRVGLLLAALLACGVVGRAALGFDFDNPDALGYLLPAIAAVYLLAAAGLAGAAAVIAGRAGGKARRIVFTGAGALAAAIAVTAFARTAPEASHRGAYAGEAWGRAVLEGLPPGTLLVTGYHETLFQVWALRAVEDSRPDVALLDRNYLTHPFAPAQARRRNPELAALIDAPLRGGSPTPVAALAGVTRARPVAFELSFNLAGDDPALPHLVPRGPLAWFSPLPVDEAARARAEAADVTRVDALARRLFASTTRADRGGADRLLLHRAFLAARFYCALGRLDAARAAFDAAWLIGPGDESLIDLDRRCALGRTLRP